MKKEILLLSVFMTAFFLVSNMVKAFPPTDHIYIVDLVINDPAFANSFAYQVVKDNTAYVYAGVEMPDMTVPTYWVSYLTGGGQYGGTHTFIFCQCLYDNSGNDVRKQAISYGCDMHLLADSVAHGNPDAIPSVIRNTGIPNIPEHPVTELGWEGVIQRDHSLEFGKLQTSLKPIINDPEMLSFVNYCINKQSTLKGYDTTGALRFLDSAFADPSGFYTRVFGIPGIYQSFAYGNVGNGLILLGIIAGLLLLKFKVIDKFLSGWVNIGVTVLIFIFIVAFSISAILFLVGGFARFADVGMLDTENQQAVDRIVNTFQTGNFNQRWNYDATGFNSLSKSDSDVMGFWYVMIAIVISAMAFSIWLIFFKRK